MGKRLLFAAVVAPPVGAIVACLGFLATGALVLVPMGESPDVTASFTHWLAFYLMLGLPLAYVVESIALAMHRSPTRIAQLRLPRILLGAAVLGGVMVFAVWGAIFGLSFGLMTLPSGILGGATAGAAFWLVGVRAGRVTPAI